MNKFEEFVNKHYRKTALFLLIAILFNTCGNPVKPLNKRIDSLTLKIDSLSNITVTRDLLKIEGLKSEKRMIQSTDRNILDVNRQSNIDRELDSLQK
jgi:hypothetical protein